MNWWWSAAAAIALFVASLAAPLLVGFDPSLSGPFSRFELIPYVALVGVAIAFPFVALLKSGRLNLAHPIPFLVITYLGPMLLGGSLIFVLTGVTHIPDELVPDPAFNYRLTLLYAAIAISALSVGALAVTSGRAGAWASGFLPRLSWQPELLLIPGCVFLIFGLAMQVINFNTGLIGYQTAVVGRFTALFYYLGLSFVLGQFFVWSAIFSARRIGLRFIVAALIAVLAALAIAAIAGSRGFLFSCWIIMAIACFTSGRPLSIRRLATLLVVGIVALVVGFAIGTMFRTIKAESAVQTQTIVSPSIESAGNSSSGSPADINPDKRSEVELATQAAQRSTTLTEQASNVRDAASAAIDRRKLPRLLEAFAARTNIVTQLAVLTARRDDLSGSLPDTLKSGILMSLATSVVPRALWPDKPIVGDAASYALHFFNFVGNSFAITPWGDLLINFGPAGIVPGMLLLGAFLGWLYVILVESLPGAAGRAAIYAVLLTQTSMEGFYATVVPTTMRVGAIALFAVAATAIMVRLQRFAFPGIETGSRGAGADA